MGIVYDYSFELKIIHHHPEYKEQIGIEYRTDERELWTEDVRTLVVEEHDDIELVFDAKDKNARLYLDALDIMPLDNSNVEEDETGRLYRKASPDSFVLYSSELEYDALRVDSFKISILCNDTWYYGVFEVLPKPLSQKEWMMMRDDLEQEVEGLAQDIVRRNIGIGDSNKEANIPLQVIYDFFVIKKYSNKMILSITDIADNPRSELITEYENVILEKGYNYKLDSNTMRRYAQKSGSEPTLNVPVKRVNYDIQDNRILKTILQEYDIKLTQFIRLIEETEQYAVSGSFGGKEQYKNAWYKSLRDFKDVAIKLKKATAILKSQEWYSHIGKNTDAYVPHSFILDNRYNTIYQMHMELKKKTMNIQLNPDFSYTWKRSSYLYEMWSYLKICHFCFEEFKLDSDEWNFGISDNIIIPFLKEGTVVNFSNGKIKLSVVYDQCLPLNNYICDLENPLYIAIPHNSAKKHNRPDIIINVFDQENNIYLGSIVIECKYRKLLSFWSENSNRSSKGQLEAYYNNARSSILLNGKGNDLNMRTVSKVIALTPDTLAEGYEQEDFNIILKNFKPTEDGNVEESVKSVLMKEIYRLQERFEEIKPLL